MVRIQSVLLLYLLVGVYVRKRNLIPASVQPYFSDFVINITMPCTILGSYLQIFGREQLLTASRIFLASTGICVLSIVLGKALFGRMPRERQTVLRYSTLISNAGFAGLPQAHAAYGEVGLFYGSVYIFPQTVFMWTAGISLFVQADRRTKIKRILLNPCILAVFLGLPIMLLQFTLPEPVVMAVNTIGDCTTPLSMIVIGMTLADIPLRSVVNRDTLLLCFFRLIGIPGLVLAALRLLGADPMLIGVSVLLTSMPVGATAPVLAQKYGVDHVFASQCVFLSTVLSLVTVPLLTLFL